MRCSNTVVHWLNILLFDILLDNSTAGVCVRSVKLSVRMFTSAMIKPWACLHRQAHATGRGGTILRTSPAAFPLPGLPRRGAAPSAPGSMPRSAGHARCLHGGEQSTETRPLDVCALLLLIASLSYSCSKQPLPFVSFHATFWGLSFSTVFLKSEDTCVIGPPQVNA